MPVYLHLTAHRASATGTNYYIDAVNGIDNNPGTEQQPWQTFKNVNDPNRTFQPGDHILLQEGESWTDQAAPETSFVHPQGSGIGTPTQGPIVIDEYCNNCPSSAKPTINGNGDNATIQLTNQQWWEINNLEITNTPGSCTGIEQQPLPASCDNSTISRRGIYVYVKNPGPGAAVYQHIYVTNVTVQDVLGYSSGVDSSNINAAEQTGGIVYYIDGHGSPATFDDIHITGTTVHDVYYEGIILTSDFKGPPASGQSCYSDWTNYQPSTHELVDSNTVYNMGGNGITVHVSSGSVVSNNLVHDGGLSGYLNEGIASLDNLNEVIKHNQVWNMQFHGSDKGAYADSVAYDVDDCDNGTKVEYNYSHDNQGGFMTIEPYAINATVRYNISEHDGYGDNLQIPNGVGAILKVPQNKPTYDAGQHWQVYDNSFYIADESQNSGPGTQLLDVALPSGLSPAPLFENNLIENVQNGSSDTYASCSGKYFEPGSGGTIWGVNYNDFYSTITPGGCPDTPSQSHVINSNGDPGYASPGQGYDGGSDNNSDWQQDAALAYVPSSTLYCTGIILEAPGDDNVDFIGNSLPNPLTQHSVDPGALQHVGSPTCP